MKIDSEEIFEKYIVPGFFVLILFIATIFIFSNFYWYKSVPINKAIHVNAIYSSYEKKSQRIVRGGYSYYIILEFSNYKKLEIEPIVFEVFDEQIENAIKGIEPGTEVSLLIHPYGDAILGLEANGKKILSYDETQKIRTKEGIGFLIFGLIIYGICISLLVFLNKRKRRMPRYVRFKK